MNIEKRLTALEIEAAKKAKPRGDFGGLVRKAFRLRQIRQEADRRENERVAGLPKPEQDQIFLEARRLQMLKTCAIGTRSYGTPPIKDIEIVGDRLRYVYENGEVKNED